MADDEGSWSRAFMASSGVSVSRSHQNLRAESAEWHEATARDLGKSRLRELAMSKSQAVREAIAERADCPFGVLISLAHDHRPAVRAAVGANSSSTPTVLEYLCGDRDVSVVKAVARNEAASDEVLGSLANHGKEDIRRVAQRRIDAAASLTMEGNSAVEQTAAQPTQYPPAASGISLHPVAAIPGQRMEPSPGDADASPHRSVHTQETEATLKRHHPPTTLAPRPVPTSAAMVSDVAQAGGRPGVFHPTSP